MLLIDIYLCTTAEEARCVLNLENSIQVSIATKSSHYYMNWLVVA